MNQFVPAGSDPTFSNDQIIEEELNKLKNFRNKIIDENEKYLKSHPEFRKLLDDFVTAVFNHKPSDVIKFGAEYWNGIYKNGKFGPYPVIIAGPSGVGKGTLITRLLSTFPDVFGFSVSHTTRAPRPGEEHGVHYFFISKPEFEESVERGDFVEYAKVHTNYYGTSFHAIDSVTKQGKVCILDIDVQGVQNVKKSKLEVKTIFIAPPSIGELEHRLRDRGTETAEKIKIRLENAVNEINYSKVPGNFDRIIVNDHIEESFNQLIETLQSWFPELDLYTRK
eukprot:gene5525-5938_t